MYDFDKFCVENNLQYWVEGGTLMGALRHGVLFHGMMMLIYKC